MNLRETPRLSSFVALFGVIFAVFATAALGADGGPPAPAVGAKGLVAHASPVAHAAAAFDPLVKTQSFTGEDMREFDRLLDENGELTPKAIAFWLGRGKLVDPTTGKPVVDPDFLEPRVGSPGTNFEPVAGKLAFKVLPVQRTATNPTIWRIKVATPGGGLSNRFITKSTRHPSDCLKEAKNLENFNDRFPPKEWAVRGLPGLARPVDTLAYENRSGNVRCFMLQEAAQGTQVGELPKGVQVKGEPAFDYFVHVLGLMHYHFLNDKTGKGPVNLWKTVTHGDAHINNVFLDPRTDKLTLIDLETMAPNSALFHDLDFRKPDPKGNQTGAVVPDSWHGPNAHVKVVEADIETLSALENREHAPKELPDVQRRAGKLRESIGASMQSVDETFRILLSAITSYTSAFPGGLRPKVEDYLIRVFLKGYPELKPEIPAKNTLDSFEAELRGRMKAVAGRLRGLSRIPTNLPPVSVVQRVENNANNANVKAFPIIYAGVRWKAEQVGSRPDAPDGFEGARYSVEKDGNKFGARYRVNNGRAVTLKLETSDYELDPRALQKATKNKSGAYKLDNSVFAEPELIRLVPPGKGPGPPEASIPPKRISSFPPISRVKKEESASQNNKFTVDYLGVRWEAQRRVRAAGPNTPDGFTRATYETAPGGNLFTAGYVVNERFVNLQLDTKDYELDPSALEKAANEGGQYILDNSVFPKPRRILLIPVESDQGRPDEGSQPKRGGGPDPEEKGDR